MREIARDDVRPSLRPYVGGACILAVAFGVGRFAYTPLLVAMHADAGLSVAGAGVLASANLTGYLVGAILAARPIASIDRTATIRFGALAVALLTAAMALQPSAWLVVRFLTGVASGIVFVLATAAMLDVPAARTPRWGLATFFSGVGLGIAGAGLAVPLVAHLAGSRGAWIALGMVSTAIVVIASR